MPELSRFPFRGRVCNTRVRARAWDATALQVGLVTNDKTRVRDVLSLGQADKLG